MRRYLKVAMLLLGLVAASPSLAEGETQGDKAPAAAQGEQAPAGASAQDATTPAETPAAAPVDKEPATSAQEEKTTAAAPEAPKGTAKDIVIVFDNSGSMRKNDPTHLATQAVADLVNGMQGDTRVALVIFDTKVNKAMPLTPLEADAKTKLQEALKAINYRGQWTNSPDAVEQTIYDLKVNGREGAQKIIIFFTDGIVETGHPSQDAEKSRWLREELAQEAARLGIKIYAVAFTEQADYQLIQSLATKTSGEYYRSLKAEDLKDAFGRIAGEIAKLDQPKPVEAAPPAPPPPAPAAEVPAPAPAPTAPAAEQQGLKEMEKATGIPKEQLEKMPEGQAIIVKPAEETEVSQGTQGLLLAIAAAIGVLSLVVIFLVIKMRRRGGQAATPVEYAPQAFLRDLQGNTNAEQHALGLKPVMLGRVAGSDTDHLNYIVVNQTTIGRRHALIEYKDFSYWVVDQGSMNGTYVNDQRVTGEQRLKHGDRIRLHKYDFEFVMPEVADAGKTVFSAAPPDRAGLTGATTAFTAPPPVAPPPAPEAGAAGEDETFDVTGAAFGTPAAPAEDVHEADTVMRARKGGGEATAPKQDIHEADTVMRTPPAAAVPAEEASLATFLNTAMIEEAPSAATPAPGEEELSLDDFMDDTALKQEASPAAPAAAEDDMDRTLMPSQVPSTASKSGGAPAEDDMDRTLMPSQVPPVAPKPATPKPAKKEERESDSTTMFTADDATLPPRRPR
ncbi:MAG TPA: VWA domain-containing protein [Gammaproteobacteria bacterium]|nr:VWA domain-containing protein [Gammaproteobacteria bacterium]